jgi:protein-S-isoprenylcysteine O-methyltransferase Ste14
MSTEPRISPLKLAATGLYLLFWPTLIFILAGTWRWIEAWIFGAWFLALCTTCIVWLYRRNPALLAERYRRPGSGGQVAWDTLVVYGLVVGFIAWIAVMPLDARRFHWSPGVPLWLRACSAPVLVCSFFLFFRSFTDNAFVSPLVRIQSDRKQQVVSSGVYGFVRHPMYLGAILMFLSVPLLLGSLAGLLVGLALALLLGGRILGEEKLLGSELEGYAEYRERVRYRLLPLVW